MDIRKIKKLIELITESDVEEIEIKEGEESIRINRRKQTLTPAAAQFSPAPILAASTPLTESLAATTPTEVSSNQSINAPMVGTFYRASSPESAPFVQVGQNVKIGDTICIIEAMKMMNQIDADQSGIIQSIEVNDGEPIEFDQVLFTIA